MKRFLQKRFLWTLTTLVVVMTLALPWVVFADNVTNDVVVGGTDTFTLGGSTTVSYKIVHTGGDGQPGCNVDDGSPATVTIINTPAGVTATPGSLVFDACNVFEPVVFTATAAGDYLMTVSVSDSGTGTYNSTPARFTLHVLPPSGDTTPPVITPSVVGTLGLNGWYVSDVTVSWTVIDDESAITSTSGCDPTTINADTAGTTLTCTATSAGGTSSQSVTIKRDATAPTFAACPLNDQGDNKFLLNSGLQSVGPIDVDTAISGLDAGLSTLTGSVDTSSIGTKSVTFTAVDNAGNSAEEECLYSVIYSFLGFFQPIDTNAVNTVKGGSTVPVKWRLQDANGNNITDVSAVASGWPKAQQISCTSLAAMPEDAIEATATGGTILRYDFSSMQFVYNWQTPKKPGTCWRLDVKFIDGETKSAYFGLK